jgi:hypothetical protein
MLQVVFCRTFATSLKSAVCRHLTTPCENVTDEAYARDEVRRTFWVQSRTFPRPNSGAPGEPPKTGPPRSATECPIGRGGIDWGVRFHGFEISPS